jgi:hypothetical protein
VKICKYSLRISMPPVLLVAQAGANQPRGRTDREE